MIILKWIKPNRHKQRGPEYLITERRKCDLITSLKPLIWMMRKSKIPFNYIDQVILHMEFWKITSLKLSSVWFSTKWFSTMCVIPCAKGQKSPSVLKTIMVLWGLKNVPDIPYSWFSLHSQIDLKWFYGEMITWSNFTSPFQLIKSFL